MKNLFHYRESFISKLLQKFLVMYKNVISYECYISKSLKKSVPSNSYVDVIFSRQRNVHTTHAMINNTQTMLVESHRNSRNYKWPLFHGMPIVANELIIVGQDVYNYAQDYNSHTL